MTATPALDLDLTPPVSSVRRRRADAVTMLTAYVFLLMIIPAWLVFSPLGAAGGLSTIFAAVVFIWYLISWLQPAMAPASGRQPVRLAAIIFACAVLATYISANRSAMSTLAENGADRGVIFTVGWVGVLMLTADGIDSLDRLRTLLRRIVLAASVMSVLAITQFFAGLNLTKYIVIPGLVSQLATTDLLSRGGLNRPSATALDPIELAAVLATCLPIAIHQARHAEPGRRLRRWFQVALIGAALPMTVSRTAVVAFVVLCLVLLPTWPKFHRRLAYGVIALGVVILWVAVPHLADTFRSLFGGISSDTSTTSRTSAFSSAEPFIAQHPWLGRGFGTFFPQTYFFTDDQYLLTTIEMGIIGLLALAGLFLTGWATARRARRVCSDPEIRQLAQCLAASVAVCAVSFATLDAFSFPVAAGLTFLMIGSAGALWRFTRLGTPATWEGLPSSG